METADGKKYLTDAADPETLLQLIQSVPSPKAEPIKLWLAKVGYKRLQDMSDPARSPGFKKDIIFKIRRRGSGKMKQGGGYRSVATKGRENDEFAKQTVQSLLSDPSHPVSIATQKMQDIPAILIVERKK